MNGFGDRAWAKRTRGTVTGYERFAQIWAAIRFQLTEKLRARPKEVGCASPGEVERMLRDIELPATHLVQKATAVVTELGPEALTSHALRTWAWGSIVALRDGLAFDRETFALAALLHDVALPRRSPGVACFAADGAEQAVKMLAEWGAAEELCEKVGNAVCLHLRVSVPTSFGVEAHLVHAGAGIDVVGTRFFELPEEIRDAVLERYPRGELKKYLTEAFGRESREHPTSRTALWVSMGFLKRVARSPFTDGGLR